MALFDLTQFQGKRVCVALSGGADSVCLLHQLFVGAPKYNITLTALTCEHGIRGDSSLADLHFVEKLCRDWNIPLTVFQRDIPACAAKNKRGLEDEGRIFRRECFKKILDEGKADIVATAHHKDDYAETVLFRLARGTSLSGLKVFSDEFARPLVGVGREQIIDYINKNGLSFVEDETNADTAYTRNALRHEVLPLLEKSVAGARENLVAFSRLAARDDEYLQSLAYAALPKEGLPRLKIDLPDPVFYRAVVLVLKNFGAERDYTRALLDEVSSLRKLQRGRRTCLPQGVIAVREGDEIVFYKEEPVPEALPFSLGTFVFGDYVFTVGEGLCEEGLRFDFDCVPEGSFLRTRREGDRFTPYAGKSKTLKKYLTDKKIPARLGHGLPLLACGNEVLAIFGVEISDKIKLTDGTKRQGYLTCRNDKIQLL